MVESFVVEVCYASPELQECIPVKVQPGTAIREVVKASGLVERYDIDWAINRVGIFGKLKTLETLVRSGDRIEIYRSLLVDPKAARLRRLEKNRSVKKLSARGPNPKGP